MIALPQRQERVADTEQARQAGARLKSDCVELGLSVRTFERWQRNGTVCADAILLQRQAVYEAARARNPLCWKQPPRAWQVDSKVWFNPPSKLDERRAA